MISCTQGHFKEYHGNTQGTTFSVKYKYGGNDQHVQIDVDSILLAIDESLSTYNNNSTISSYNESDSGLVIDKLFKKVFELSNIVFNESKGDFDPSVAPLVWAYGFGPQRDTMLSTEVLDSIKNLIGLEKFWLQDDYLSKPFPSSKLDFNAIAQGYTVDLVAQYLTSLNIENYLVEIGGEIRVRGKNQNNELWKIGIDRPVENLPNRQVFSVIALNNKSFATSGNYRKFYEKNGQKYTHTINPRTGKTVLSNLLSATVVHESCALADAYATTLMVKGLESGIQFADSLDLDVYLIYSEKDELKEYISPSLSERISY